MDTSAVPFFAPSTKLALATLAKPLLMTAMGASLISISLRNAPEDFKPSVPFQNFLHEYVFAPAGMLLISASLGFSAAVSQDCKNRIFFSQSRYNSLFNTIYPFVIFAAAAWVVIQFGVSAFFKLVAVPAFLALPSIFSPSLFSAQLETEEKPAEKDPKQRGRPSVPLYHLRGALRHIEQERARSPRARSPSPVLTRHTSVLPGRVMALDLATWGKRFGVVFPLLAISIAANAFDAINPTFGGFIVLLGVALCYIFPSRGRAMDIHVSKSQKAMAARQEKEVVQVFLYGKKLDVSSFLAKHPGGPKPLRIYHNRDATEVFEACHSDEAAKQMRGMLKLFGKEMTAAEKDAIRSPRDYDMVAKFSAFRQMLVEKGYFKRRYFDEVRKFAEWSLMWFPGIYLMRSDDYAVRIAGFFLYTLSIQQIGWMSHDHAHHSTAEPWIADIFAEFCAGIQTYSRDWWKARHNPHHVATNEIHNDPDIKLAPLFTYLAGMISKATGHNDLAEREWHKQGDGPCPKKDSTEVPGARDSRFIPQAVKRLSAVQMKQSKYFVPLLSLLHLYWMVDSYMYLAMRVGKKWPHLLFLLANHAIVAYAFQKLGWLWYIAFIIVKGYGTSLVVFATHYGEGRLPPTHTLSLAEQTGLTTRNIAGGPFNFYHWYTGAISLQIEHHLFPTMPRTNYVKIQPLVKKFYKDNGIPYLESTLVGCIQHNIKMLETEGVELGHLATLS